MIINPSMGHADKVRPPMIDVKDVISEAYTASINQRITYKDASGEEKSVSLMDLLYKHTQPTPQDHKLRERVNTALEDFVRNAMTASLSPRLTANAQPLREALEKYLDGKVPDPELISSGVAEFSRAAVDKTMSKYDAAIGNALNA